MDPRRAFSLIVLSLLGHACSGGYGPQWIDNEPTSISASNTNLTLGPNPVTIKPTGTGVTVTDQVTGGASPRDCADGWVTF